MYCQKNSQLHFSTGIDFISNNGKFYLNRRGMKKIIWSLVSLFVFSWLLVPAFCFAAPSLESSSGASPSEVYKKGLASPDLSTITVTLQGGGTPGQIHAPADIILAIDVSGSMDGLPLTNEIAAAKNFIDNMDPTTDQVGVVAFETSATLEQALTTNFAGAKTVIDGLVALNGTDFADGVNVSAAELNGVNHRSNASKVLIFMSDGEPTWPDPDPIAAGAAAATAAKADGITIYTIGLGEGIDQTLLKLMASSTTNTDDHYFYAPSSNDLTAIYEQIAGYLNNIAGQNITLYLKLDPELELVTDSWSQSPATTINGVYSFAVGTISIGSTWTVSFNVQFPHASDHNIFDVSQSVYSYVDYQGQDVAARVPQTVVQVSDITGTVSATPSALPQTGGETSFISRIIQQLVSWLKLK